MANRATRRRNRSRIIKSGGIAAATVLAAAHPLVYAAGNTYTWARQDSLDNHVGYYTSVATSGTGQDMIGAVRDASSYEGISPLFLSKDYGASWEDVHDSLDDPTIFQNWASTDISSDGQTIVAASSNAYDTVESEGLDGGIFLSQDGGNTWENIAPDGVSEWMRVAVSGDGSKVVALTNDDYDYRAYIFTNNGTSYTTEDVSAMNSWDVLEISNDGSKILVGGESFDGVSPRSLYLSSDGGDNWSDISPSSGYSVDVAATMSADGSKIAAVFSDSDSGVFVSEDSGANWTDMPLSGGDDYWNDIAMSGDGSVLSVTNSSVHEMYTSTDDGATWNAENPDLTYGDSNTFWGAADLSSDGSRFILSGGEDLFTSIINEPTEEAPVVDFGNAEDGKTVVLTLPSGTTITCHSAVKESSLTAQDPEYQYPLGLVDFCFNTEQASNDITLTFVTSLKPDEVAIRKYNPDTKTYTNVTGANVTETTHEGKHALQITYTIVDNGPLDMDPDPNEIADPVGIGIAPAELASSGEPAVMYSLVAGMLIITGLSLTSVRKLAKQASR